MDPKVAIWIHIYLLATHKIEALRKIAEDMFTEISNAANPNLAPAIRNGSMVSVMNKLDTQWREFARQIGSIDPNGFANLVKKKRPEDFQFWANLRVRIGKPLTL